MRAKEAKTGVAHEASSRREGGTVRPDRMTHESEPACPPCNFHTGGFLDHTLFHLVPKKCIPRDTLDSLGIRVYP